MAARAEPNGAECRARHASAFNLATDGTHDLGLGRPCSLCPLCWSLAWSVGPAAAAAAAAADANIQCKQQTGAFLPNLGLQVGLFGVQWAVFILDGGLGVYVIN